MAETSLGTTPPPGVGPSDSGQLEVFLKSNPASTGVLAGVVTMSGQIAAQLHAPGLACRIVALGFALLLAYYQVGVAQRRPRVESVLLVPIVAVILFTTGWGANGLIYEAYARQLKETTQVSATASNEASFAERLVEVIIPVAHADERGDTDKRKKDGWKSW